MTLIFPEVSYDSVYFEISWTSGDEDIASKAYIDGKIRGNISGEVDRKFFVQNVEKTINAEIQDTEDSTKSIYDFSNSRPVLFWVARSGAELYRIYCDEIQIGEIKADTSQIYYYQIRERISGSWGEWHSFRIEAVNSSGTESARNPWQFWIYDTPNLLESVEIENGTVNGKFTINIEE